MRRIVLFVLAMALGTYTGPASIADDNPRGWPLSTKLSNKERAIVIQTMTIIERECPRLAEFNWKALPAPDSDPQQIVSSISIYHPDGKAFNIPAIAIWTVQVPIFFDPVKFGPAISIVAGGPENAGLAVRDAGGYLGAKICHLNQDAPDGYRYRAVQSVSDLMKQLAQGHSEAIGKGRGFKG